MGTRGWTLSSFVGCCLWILHGTSHIFLRAQVLPKPLQGTAGTLMRCFSLLAALESPLNDQSLQYMAAKELEKCFTRQASP